MDSEFMQTLWLTGKLATMTTAILFVVGMPVAYWLAYCRFRLKSVVEAMICMPMVLPPTVMGYYLLVAFSPQSGVGRWLSEWLDIRLAFSFEGVLVASVLFGLPFMIQPLQNGLAGLSVSLREASYTLGKSKWETFFRVLLPNIRPSVITGVAMTFAHCIGEFGIVLMVGGNMPGETRVASIAIYDEVQALNYSVANQYAGVLFLMSFLLLVGIFVGSSRRVG